MTCLVLDKSYLRGASGTEIDRLTSEYEVLMLETLFYELATAPEVEFRGLLAKISKPADVRLLPRPGVLFQYEIRERKPVSPVVDHILPGNCKLNPSFIMSASELEALKEWEGEVAAEVDGYPDMARGIESWSIGLAGLSQEARIKKCVELKETLTSEHVRAVYRDIAGNTFEEFPEAELIEESWALFRWTQSQIVGALDFFASYGSAESDPSRKRLENHIHDLDYLTVGGLVGTLATRDKLLAENLRILRPGVTIVS